MKTLICGFFGEGNLGDDSIVQAILQNLPESSRAIVTAGKAPCHRAASIRRRGLLSWFDYISSLKSSRRVIFSGGILQDWSLEGVTFFALRIIAASAFGCRPSIWGGGIGPLRRTGTDQLARRALKRIETAWLRDASSMHHFKRLTGKSANRGTDWSWAFAVEKTQGIRENGTMALNLRQWDHSDWRSDIASQLRHNQRHIIGLAARKGDLTTIKEIAPNATVMCPASFTEFASACANSSLGIAMRYHAALAMLRVGIPVKLIAYDDKVSDLAEEAGITTLAKNCIAGFQTANSDFFASNAERIKLMQESFGEYLQQTESGNR